MNLTSTQQTILKYLAEKGGTGNVMEALNYDSGKFDEGFAIALAMENSDMVKLLYSNFNKNLIVVEMTLVGSHTSNNNQQ